MHYFILFLIFLGTSLLNSKLEAKDPLGDLEWELLGSKKGVLLKRKIVPGSSLFALRGEILIKSPIERVASVICNHKRWIEWTKDMKSFKDLGTAADKSKIVYQSFNMPAFIDNREVVYAFKLTPVKNGLLIIGEGRPNLPKFHNQDHTTMDLVLGRWLLRETPKKYTTVELDVLMDPKGSLPSWFVNIVQKDYPADVLSALATQTKKPDIKPFSKPITSCNF